MWGQKKEANPNDTVTEITPQQVNESVTAIKADLEKKMGDLGDRIDNHPTLLAMKEFLEKEKAEQLEADAQAQRAADQSRSRQFENLDPGVKQYVDSQLSSVAQATLWQQGTEMRRTIFDNETAFPLYTGALKEKIDAYLDKQPAQSRANPEIIRNVYKIVCFDNEAEIKEGKHRSRLASATNAGTGVGVSSAERDSEGLLILSAAEKHVASRMGITEKEYAKAKQELEEESYA